MVSGLAALLLAWPPVGRSEALHARQLRDARAMLGAETTWFL